MGCYILVLYIYICICIYVYMYMCICVYTYICTSLSQDAAPGPPTAAAEDRAPPHNSKYILSFYVIVCLCYRSP